MRFEGYPFRFPTRPHADQKGQPMASDEVTIDVGPVWCPSCKREFGSTERDALRAEVSALRAALKAIDGMVLPGPIQRIARDTLGRYPKEASDG